MDFTENLLVSVFLNFSPQEMLNRVQIPDRSERSPRTTGLAKKPDLPKSSIQSEVWKERIDLAREPVAEADLPNLPN